MDNASLLDPVTSYVEKHLESHFEWEMKVSNTYPKSPKLDLA